MIIGCEEEPQVKRQTDSLSIHPSSAPASSCARRHFIAETTHAHHWSIQSSQFHLTWMLTPHRKVPDPGNRTGNLLGVRYIYMSDKYSTTTPLVMSLPPVFPVTRQKYSVTFIKWCHFFCLLFFFFFLNLICDATKIKPTVA